LDLVVALLLGGLTGWTAAVVLGTDHRRGAFASMLIGVVGSVIGGALASRAGPPVATSLARWLISIGGAVVVLAIVRGLAPRRARPPV
jgi:uncharacterized membrane protein YeaQ/YmgE (transglycosylase-associated protein family)